MIYCESSATYQSYHSCHVRVFYPLCCHWFGNIVTLSNWMVNSCSDHPAVLPLLSKLTPLSINSPVVDACSHWCLPSFHRMQPSHFLGNVLMIFLFPSIIPKDFLHIVTSSWYIINKWFIQYDMRNVWTQYSYVHSILGLLHEVGYSNKTWSLRRDWHL